MGRIVTNPSDEFAALLEEQLAAAIYEEDTQKIKRPRCAHPTLLKGMCVKCAQVVDDDLSGVPLGYIHRDLKVASQELARLRKKDLNTLFQKKKLILVLDLDHTLLNSTHFQHISPDEEYIKNQIDSVNLFQLDQIQMFTKLRPFVRDFLKQASSLFELYIYTMGEQRYAMEMARLLDPDNAYFNSRVISQADCTKKHQKGLDVVVGSESVVVVLDDTEHVWQQHKENLILMDRYHYFSSSSRSFGLNQKSLSEVKRDESESDGALATILGVLQRIHQLFFDFECYDDLMERDVRQVLKTVRREVLKGCKLVFSGVWRIGEKAENQKLWRVAEDLGAICCEELDSSVTHKGAHGTVRLGSCRGRVPVPP
ncbi:hypothetical protein MKW98_024118 [Papaver atlanticum]|uniref:RNA polymerase II C-terminal domain phosphatase-like n=1 Tax=Papaver atlanticum TaxID=357466 RepID=A0AAD4T040_9MAGN|nr:hypothetical protein MKW98_024118 [Papaver atlanticum]